MDVGAAGGIGEGVGEKGSAWRRRGTYGRERMRGVETSVTSRRRKAGTCGLTFFYSTAAMAIRQTGCWSVELVGGAD